MFLNGSVPGWGGGTIKELEGKYPKECVAHDHIVDAMIAAVTASMDLEFLRTLPEDPPRDSEDRLMEMVFAEDVPSVRVSA